MELMVDSIYTLDAVHLSIGADDNILCAIIINIKQEDSEHHPIGNINTRYNLKHLLYLL